MRFLNLFLLGLAFATIANIGISDGLEGNSTCVWCTDIVDIVKAEMKFSNASITILEKIMETVCHTIIIKPERLECLDIVNDLQNITAWIMDGLYPKDICEKLHLCQNSTEF
jgi:hypothetical protein